MQLRQKCRNKKKIERIRKEFATLYQKKNSKQNIKSALPVRDKKYLHMISSCIRKQTQKPKKTKKMKK